MELYNKSIIASFRIVRLSYYDTETGNRGSGNDRRKKTCYGCLDSWICLIRWWHDDMLMINFFIWYCLTGTNSWPLIEAHKSLPVCFIRFMYHILLSVFFPQTTNRPTLQSPERNRSSIFYHFFLSPFFELDRTLLPPLTYI